MENIRLPIGSADFEYIRRNELYYIDKTHIVSKLIREGARSILFTRPRRFGKTTLITMLRSFFDVREDSHDIFRGLAIMKEEKVVAEWMNKRPVIYLTFKDIDGLTFDSALDVLKSKLSDLFQSYKEAAASASEGDKRLFMNICDGNCTLSEIRLSLEVLSKLLFDFYGKKVILLFDEYDVPLDKAENNGYYREMLDVIHALFLSVLKDCPYIEKGVLTGCLRISRESLFTGLNNLSVYSVTGDDYCDAFGFTEEEAMRLLSDACIRDKADTMREWYDGYRIGKEHIYTPWDVLSYTRKLQSNPVAEPENYWANSSGNDAIRRLIDMTDAGISEDYRILIEGGKISKKIAETLTYRNLYSSEENIWSLLLSTGYLTLADVYHPNAPMELQLPNLEIRHVFASAVDEWFSETVRKSDRHNLFTAIWEEDDEELSRIISAYLRQTISTYDFQEHFYHAFLAELLSGTGYIVKSNRESGDGRPDLILLDNKKGQAAVFELKRASDLNSMERSADEAVNQLKLREYGNDLVDYDRIIGFGISFFRKRAFVRKANI